MQQRKKIIMKILFLIIAVPPAITVWTIFAPSLTGIEMYVSYPQLSEKTVLSLSDNLSILEITGKSNFKNDNFRLKICNEGTACYSDLLQNKTIAYITCKGISSETADYSSIKFYYDTIDNCSKYYEISYNPETNKALCIDGKISRTNPFSAKIVINNDTLFNE